MSNILEDRNLAFHGIGFDYFKMLSILENGILSQHAAQDKGIVLNRNYGGYNGDYQVSLSESPSINDTYNHGAFGTYIKSGISFVVDTTGLSCFPDHSSHIPGEIYANFSVPTENIIGVMLPEESLNTSIDKLSIVMFGGTGYIDNIALSFIDKINSNFGSIIEKNEILELIEEKKNFDGDFFDGMMHEQKVNDKIKELITNYFAISFKDKYHLSEMPTLMDTINILTEGKIPIYSTSGELLSKEVNKSL